MCSIAQASSPSTAPVCRVAIDASRSALTSASPCASSAHGIHASTMFGAGETVLKVISVMTPSVPSDPMKRSMRSIPGAAWYPADRLATSGMRYVGTGTDTRPLAVSIARRPCSARCAPRRKSSTVPSASTTVNASTQSRVLPYLKVAAPAAFVATMPPANAPVNVGAGGNHAPTSVSCSWIAATVTPGSTVIRPGPMSTMRVIFVVARIVSPIGVAPPVREDCAPIGRTAEDDRRTSMTSAVERGKTMPAAWPPGKLAASMSQSSVGSRWSSVTVLSPSRQSESSVTSRQSQSLSPSRSSESSAGLLLTSCVGDQVRALGLFGRSSPDTLLGRSSFVRLRRRARCGRRTLRS